MRLPDMAIAHRHPRFALLITLLTTLILALVHPLVGQAETTACNLYAAPDGSDEAAGTAEAPLRSPQALADALSVGQVGCFMTGMYDASEQGVKVSNAGVTLTTAPGAEATIVGRLWIAEGADDVTISRLNLDGRGAAIVGGPVVDAADTTFDEVDVTNEHTAICFILGSPEYGMAEDTVIENSHIHDCGVLPAINHDHGIYVENAEGAVIRDNWIYDNADRGIQLYPHAVDSHIYGNVIDGNGQGIIFSSAGDQASTGNVVEGNVISNSRLRWNVESYWEGPVGEGNVVRDNCVWSPSENGYYAQDGGIQPASAGAKGFVAEGNVVAEPRFVDRADGDLSLQADSPCDFTQEGSEADQVTLEQPRRSTADDGSLMLTGHAAAPVGQTVTIVRWSQGAWRHFARRRVRRDGSFVVRKRLRGIRGAARLRARVAGVGSSRVVRVRLGPRSGRRGASGLASASSIG
jgi:hypothetical protein